jgi:hypothetical protein
MQRSQNLNVYHYTNLKYKLLKRNANINFNKIYLKQQIISNYAKVRQHNKITTWTLQKIQTTQMKHEIKHLYHKKQQITVQNTHTNGNPLEKKLAKYRR